MAFSRRWFLFSLPAACVAQTSAFKRYADPATEFQVLRLTDPSYTSFLSSISRHGFMICASDTSGRFEAYRVDLKTGLPKKLTDASDLNPHSVSLLPDERNIAYLDGPALMTAGLSSARARVIFKTNEAKSIAIAEDGSYAVAVEEHRLRLIHMAKGTAETLVECDEEVSDPLPRPKRASVLYRRGGGLWLANHDGKQNYRLRLAEGGIGPALWSPDGRSIFYLQYPADAHKLHAIREFIPDSNEDKAVANTSQFVGIGRNADASVFAGASGSKASPYVLLLVKTVRRELTLCEHRASNPLMVQPVFAPNSQRVFFGSDRHGKPAIYSIAVDKLVEETESA